MREKRAVVTEGGGVEKPIDVCELRLRLGLRLRARLRLAQSDELGKRAHQHKLRPSDGATNCFQSNTNSVIDHSACALTG